MVERPRGEWFDTYPSVTITSSKMLLSPLGIDSGTSGHNLWSSSFEVGDGQVRVHLVELGEDILSDIVSPVTVSPGNIYLGDMG